MLAVSESWQFGRRQLGMSNSGLLLGCSQSWKIREFGQLGISWEALLNLRNSPRGLHWASLQHGSLEVLGFLSDCSGRQGEFSNRRHKSHRLFWHSLRSHVMALLPHSSIILESQACLDSGKGTGPPPPHDRSTKDTLWNNCGMENTVMSTLGKYDLTQILKNKILKWCAFYMVGL